VVNRLVLGSTSLKVLKSRPKSHLYFTRL